MLTVKSIDGTYSAGMTIVELLIVMAIIGIIASLSLVTVSSYRYAGRDAERTSDAQAIARSFEISYLRDTTASGPSYPTTTKATDTTSYKALFSGQGLEATRAPGKTTGTSIVAATSITQPQSPSIDQYIYLPLTTSGSLCTGTNICVRFLLYYHLEYKDQIQVVESVHQQ